MNASPRNPYIPEALLLCGAMVPCELLEGIATKAGFDVAAKVARWPHALDVLADTAVDVVIVDLALVGSVGVRIITLLRVIAPSCEVIVISPLYGIGPSLRRAGAFAVVSTSDLRPLSTALSSILGSEPSPQLHAHDPFDR